MYRKGLAAQGDKTMVTVTFNGSPPIAVNMSLDQFRRIWTEAWKKDVPFEIETLSSRKIVINPRQIQYAS